MEAELVKSRSSSKAAWFSVAAMLLSLLTAACTDPGEVPLRECQRLKGEANLNDAIKACEQAVSASAKSKAGLAAASLVSELRATLAAQERQAEETRKALLVSGKVDDLRKLSKDYEAKQLDDTAAEIAAHAALPGEETIRDSMVANHKQLADQNRKWARAFKAFDGNLAPFAALQAATELLAEQVLEKDTDTFNACLKGAGGGKP
jgi:hypothetical protein